MSNRFPFIFSLLTLGLLCVCQPWLRKETTQSPTHPNQDAGVDNLEKDAGPPPSSSTNSPFQNKVCSTNYGEANAHFTLPGTLLLEISGLSPSGRSENVFWAHNDSGDAAQIYAIHKSGAHLATLEMNGVEARDFEDMASAPCPEGTGHCLFIADVGDNQHVREFLSVHLLEEPALDETLSQQNFSQNVLKTFHLTFSGLKPNIEAFVVNSTNNHGYFFEKTDNGQPRIFAFDFLGQTEQALESLGSFAPPTHNNLTGYNVLITAGAYHSPAKRLLLKTYGGIYEYRLVGGKTLEDLASITPLLIAERPQWELQGEAITFSFAGDAVLSASEARTESGNQQVSEFACATSLP